MDKDKFMEKVSEVFSGENFEYDSQKIIPEIKNGKFTGSLRSAAFLALKGEGHLKALIQDCPANYIVEAMNRELDHQITLERDADVAIFLVAAEVSLDFATIKNQFADKTFFNMSKV